MTSVLTYVCSIDIRILPKLIVFQWDSGNIRKNIVKHNVTTQEAEEIFNQLSTEKGEALPKKLILH